MVTLKDIADHVGISVTAASLALRDHRSISMETKERVWSAQEQLGYHRHRKPRRASRGTAGVVKQVGNVAFLLVDRQFKDLAYASQFQAIADSAAAHGFCPMYLSAQSSNLRKGILPPLLKSKEVDGIIVSGIYDEAEHQQLKKLNIPIVVMGNYDLGAEPWAACETDDRAGVRLMVDRVVELGHRRLGMLWCSTVLEAGFVFERTYLNCLSRHGAVNAGIASVEGNEDIRPSLLSLLKKTDRPTALLIPLSGEAVHAYDICQELGLRIPHDLSIICYGDGEGLLRPSIATVTNDPAAMAQGAMAKLMRMIQDPQSTPTREIYGPRLVPGGSIAAPPEKAAARKANG